MNYFFKNDFYIKVTNIAHSYKRTNIALRYKKKKDQSFSKILLSCLGEMEFFFSTKL